MKEIPLSELKNHINKELTMIFLMNELSQTFSIQLKSVGATIKGYNKDRRCLFEIHDLKNVKFYISE